jgi:hypothetical protein
MYEILTGTAAFPSTDLAFPIMKKIVKGEMPAVPDECGPLMQDLISRGWLMDPEKRPRADEIVRDFRDRQFRIVPRADAVRVGMYVADIEAWEAKDAALSRSK